MSVPQGVWITTEMVDSEGENLRSPNVIVTLRDKTIDVRLDNEEGTIVVLDLDEIEEAIKTLKRWQREQ